MPKTYEEYLKIKARVEDLQRSQRNLLGEELSPPCSKELGHLENQLALSLKQIRTRKTQLLLDQLCDLKSKQQVLKEANKVLEQKLQEPDSSTPMQLSWEGGGGQHSENFFQPLHCAPQLQIGYNPMFYTN